MLFSEVVISKEVNFSSFEAELKGIGAFPKISNPRVIWIGISNGMEELIKIFNQIEPLLEKIGFNPDYKKFSPHITIARVKSLRNKQQLNINLKNNSLFYIGKIHIKSLKLKKSDLSPIGPIYTTIKQFNSKSEV